MGTPQEERGLPRYANNPDRPSDEEATVIGDTPQRQQSSHTNNDAESNSQFLFIKPITTRDNASSEPKSPGHNREQAHRLDDDLHMLQVEQAVSADFESKQSTDGRANSRARATTRSRSRREEPIDEFDAATNPAHERAQIYSPPSHPENHFAKFFAKVHQSNWVVRYFTYIVPLVILILVPILIGYKLPAANGTQKNADGSLKKKASVGGVEMTWFCIWLMIVWLGLWAGRVLAKCLPWPIGIFVSLFTNNSKKWRDMSKQLEIPATIFFWQLAVEISFLPIMRSHKVKPDADLSWTKTMNKVLVTFLVAGILNFVEKIIIQLIAIGFHLRTYQDRIEVNKFQIGSLVKLYQFSKKKIAMEDSDFEMPSGGIGSAGSGAHTPGQYMEKAQKTTKEVFNKFGDAAGKVAGDFTGKNVKQSSHPNQVVLSLLWTTGGSQVLARRLYRTFGREDTQTIFAEDLTDAFENEEETDAAFTMFDKDMNGDISMEELEAVCVEIGRERKSITASLKDLDSVVSKLDDVLTLIVLIVVVLVFLSLISISAASALGSAGSAALALSWLFSATAQEFLQSVIFVFVKHPFDVGDRVTIYGNTGMQLKGDDYYVKEISLLYTEFKKLQGHVVQAPNSYLNTLFVLNMRRSGGLAEAIPLVLKFGTSLEQMEALRSKLLDFVKIEKREYQSKILTELVQIDEVHSITFNVIFFFKSNWQNELLRLQRRNKFICALMVAMQELGIEGPRMRYPGQREQFPLYMQQMPYDPTHSGHYGTPDHPAGIPRQEGAYREETTLASDARESMSRNRPRGESLSDMNRRMDFSLGMKGATADDYMGDVHGARERTMSRAVNAAKYAVFADGTAKSPRRLSHDHSVRATHGRSSSVSDRFHPSTLIHRSTTAGPELGNRASPSLHRNRFFGRKSYETDRMEEGMAGIPEESHRTSRIDPRSGMVSPEAVRADSRQNGSIAGQETTEVSRL